MIRFFGTYLATVVIGWLGWSAAVQLGIGWTPLTFPQALAGAALIWIVFGGYSLAIGSASERQ